MIKAKIISSRLNSSCIAFKIQPEEGNDIHFVTPDAMSDADGFNGCLIDMCQACRILILRDTDAFNGIDLLIDKKANKLSFHKLKPQPRY